MAKEFTDPFSQINNWAHLRECDDVSLHKEIIEYGFANLIFNDDYTNFSLFSSKFNVISVVEILNVFDPTFVVSIKSFVENDNLPGETQREKNTYLDHVDGDIIGLRERVYAVLEAIEPTLDTTPVTDHDKKIYFIHVLLISYLYGFYTNYSLLETWDERECELLIEFLIYLSFISIFKDEATSISNTKITEENLKDLDLFYVYLKGCSVRNSELADVMNEFLTFTWNEK